MTAVECSLSTSALERDTEIDVSPKQQRPPASAKCLWRSDNMDRRLMLPWYHMFIALSNLIPDLDLRSHDPQAYLWLASGRHEQSLLWAKSRIVSWDWLINVTTYIRVAESTWIDRKVLQKMYWPWREYHMDRNIAFIVEWMWTLGDWNKDGCFLQMTYQNIFSWRRRKTI